MRQWMCAAVVAWLAAFPVLAQAPAADEIVAAAGTHRLIVLGEKHGTVEIPALVADLAARYADEGPLLLALEVRRSEHVALSNYLRAGDARVGTLRRRAAWSMPPERNDGRRSEAMLALIEALRRLRAKGRDVAVYPYDLDESSRGSQARDQAMAEHLRRGFAALPRGRMLVLAGNVHAMLRKPDYCPQCQTPMTSYLRDLDPYTVDIVARRGAFWGCRERCGPVPLPAAAAHARSGPTPSGQRQTYHYQLVLPRFTPAPLVPAR